MKKVFSDDEKALIWLDSFVTLEYKYKKTLLENAGAPSELLKDFDRFKELFSKDSDIFSEMKRCLNREYWNALERSLEGVGILTQKEYPEELKAASKPPLLLYYKGDVSLLKKRKFGIVGSRKSSKAALEYSKLFAETLSKDFCIVTGLAEGADSYALEGGLINKNAVSILAYGFDYVFPEMNRQLLKRTEEQGLVITEHTPKVRPQGFLFPLRNRLIAALSEGVLIASAGEKSGALYTAAFAKEYGKKVFAFPYNPGLKSGEGCNNLIREGAILTTSCEDIYRHTGLKFKKDEIKIQLTDEERKVYELLKREDLHIEKIAAETNLKIFELKAALSMLEIKKLVIPTGGNVYSAI